MKIKKMILIAACLLPLSVSAEEVGIWWENPTHNTDGSQIIEADKIMSATIYAYDLGSLVLEQSVIYPNGGHKTAATLTLMCGGEYQVLMDVTNRLGETSSKSNVVTIVPEGCPIELDPVDPDDPDFPIDPDIPTVPHPPILFTIDGIVQPLFSSGWVSRVGKPTLDWVYEPQPAFQLAEGYIVLEFQVAKSGILVSRSHKDSNNGFQIMVQTSNAKPKKEICISHGDKTMCDRGLFELGKPMHVLYQFGPDGATLHIDGALRSQKKDMNAGFSEDNLPLVIGAGSYSVTGTYPDIDPAELGWPTRGDISVEIYTVLPPSIQ